MCLCVGSVQIQNNKMSQTKAIYETQVMNVQVEDCDNFITKKAA